MTTTKKIAKETPKKKSTKKATKRKATRRRLAWANRKTFVAAVARPGEVTQSVPEGFKIFSVQPLGVLGTKIWLEVNVVPEV